MNKNQLYTNKLIEKVYYSNSKEKDEKAKEQIQKFLTELHERRREDPYEGGLQAEMVVMPEAFAAKVNENNGYDYHKITGVNLLRYIKKEDKYYSKEAIKHYGLLYNEANDILNNGVEIRILDGKNAIIVAIVSNKGIKSQYQIDTLKILIDNLKESQSKRLYTHVKVGLCTMNGTVECEDIKEQTYNKLINSLENEENILNIKASDELER
ncbi:MAG: hypothetical protein IJH76_04340 [Clostridia bacterium]|nr:hypothetical protein [Clostridia bacterium]